ncbi:DMT family transporter [Pseudomonadota bacterium]
MNTDVATTRSIPIVGLMFVLVGAFTFSAKAVIIKLAYGYGAEVSPIVLMTLRMVMSLPFFLVAGYLFQRGANHAPLNRRDYVHLIGVGVLGYYLAAYLDFLGLSYISASLERLVLLLYPTLVVLMSALFFRRPITRREAVALLVSYVGIVIVFAEELSLAGADIILGSALVFGSATAFALYLVGSGELMKRMGAMRFTSYAMSIACIATIIHFGIDYDAAIYALPKEVYGLSLIMAVVCTVIPTFLMNAGIHRIGASPAAIVSSIGPVMTIFLAYLVLGEQLTFVQFIGAVLVMVGVFVVSNKKGKTK